MKLPGPKNLTKEAVEDKIMYAAFLISFMTCLAAAFIANLIFDIDMKEIMPYGIVGSAFLGWLTASIWSSRNDRSKP